MIDEIRGEGKVYKTTKEKIVTLDRHVLKLQGKIAGMYLTEVGLVILIPHGKVFTKQLFNQIGKE